jgi:hypothetical protein
LRYAIPAQFEAVIRNLLNTPPMPMAEITAQA